MNRLTPTPLYSDETKSLVFKRNYDFTLTKSTKNSLLSNNDRNSKILCLLNKKENPFKFD